MSVSVYVGTLHEDANGKYSEPVGDDEAYVNMTNRNAGLVLGQLGVEGEDIYCGSMDYNKFRNLVRNWLRTNLNKPSKGFETTVTANEGHATVYDFGVDDGYINRKIHEISLMLAAYPEGDIVYWG